MTAGPAPDRLDRALAALPPPPPPPAFERVAAAYDARRMVDAVRRRLSLAAAAVAALVVGAGLFAALRGAPEPGDRGAAIAALETTDPAAAVVLRGGRVVGGAPRDVAAGDRVEARGPLRLRLGARATLDLSAGARLTVVGPTELEQHAGLVVYDVVHDARTPFRVRAGGLAFADAGTRFSVDVGAADGPARVLLAVEDGAVDAGALRVPAGYGVAFLDGAPAGAPWPLDAKPLLALEVEDAAPVAGRPVTLRVVLENPTDGWIALPTADGPRSPLWIEVTPPNGASLPLRVTDDALVDGARGGGAIPPRGRLSVRVRLTHAFGSPGTYRCRAVYRPADAVDPPASAEVSVLVR